MFIVVALLKLLPVKENYYLMVNKQADCIHCSYHHHSI